MGVGGQRHAPAALPLGKRPATHGAGDCVAHWDGLDECGKHRQHRDSICGQSSPQRVARPTTLQRPTKLYT